MSDRLSGRLAAELAVCEDATWGPWQVLKERVVTEDMDMVTPRLHSAPDAEFIAHARTGYPLALRALQAVMEVHKPIYASIYNNDACLECLDSMGDQVEWPCPTMQAVEEAMKR